jgi:hypothetical protein
MIVFQGSSLSKRGAAMGGASFKNRKYEMLLFEFLDFLGFRAELEGFLGSFNLGGWRWRGWCLGSLGCKFGSGSFRLLVLIFADFLNFVHYGVLLSAIIPSYRPSRQKGESKGEGGGYFLYSRKYPAVKNYYEWLFHGIRIAGLMESEGEGFLVCPDTGMVFSRLYAETEAGE